MCFSASASFTASAILFPLGLYAVVKSLKSNPSYVLLMCIPILFGIQQFSEGLIWITLHHTNPFLLSWSTWLYLLTAFCIWPIYFPLALYHLESNRQRKKWLLLMVLFGCCLSPLLFMKSYGAKAQLEHQSITYFIDQALYSEYIFTLCYLLLFLLSSFICSIKSVRLFGILLLLSFLVSSIWFLYAFASVWCYFSAVESLIIVYIATTLKKTQVKKVR
ncbi:MAG: hypothetical protein CK424_04095 [Legionella sp.]|nr:MAG: hypothetical protein CK424_04095 [Legionella sp.]